jgi:hypothetical protein
LSIVTGTGIKKLNLLENNVKGRGGFSVLFRIDG